MTSAKKVSYYEHIGEMRVVAATKKETNIYRYKILLFLFKIVLNNKCMCVRVHIRIHVHLCVLVRVSVWSRWIICC